jgi:hypothetical protein
MLGRGRACATAGRVEGCGLAAWTVAERGCGGQCRHAVPLCQLNHCTWGQLCELSHRVS